MEVFISVWMLNYFYLLNWVRCIFREIGYAPKTVEVMFHVRNTGDFLKVEITERF